jgi:hypothetical protein
MTATTATTAEKRPKSGAGIPGKRAATKTSAKAENPPADVDEQAVAKAQADVDACNERLDDSYQEKEIAATKHGKNSDDAKAALQRYEDANADAVAAADRLALVMTGQPGPGEPEAPPAEAESASQDAGADEDDGEPEDGPAFDGDVVEQVKAWEAQADHLDGKADSFRSQAAAGIVQLLATPGATERSVAAIIGKTGAHVHHSKVAWELLQTREDITSFSVAYAKAKAKKPTVEVETAESSAVEAGPDHDDGDADEPPERPSPSWTRQIQSLKSLIAQMIEHAGNDRQTGQLSNVLETGLRGALTKQQDQERVSATAARNG